MDYFPLFFKLKDRECLVVGGGAVAARKIRLLLKTNVKLSLVAKELHSETETLCKDNSTQIEIIDGSFTEDLLLNKALVIAATNDAEFNRSVAKLCHLKNIPINVVDQPDECTVITPAIIDRDPVVIAISTSGAAPVLGRKIRTQIELLLPQKLGPYVARLASLRPLIKKAITDASQRLRFWQGLVEGEAYEKGVAGNINQADAIIRKRLEDYAGDAKSDVSEHGEVYLVGAGPGDPELLTLKALRLMQLADVVLYDRLVSDEIMDLVRRDADRIYVGKRRDDHAVPQESINQQLASLAKQGKRVLRLKGGDPFIFGRGGEELETLAAQGVSFQVVPGITAASGCASYAGIPLTHRDHAQSVRFITGHLKDNEANIRWAELAATDQTLVFYMSLVGLPKICQALIENGRAPSTPAALIEKGTTVDQRVLVADLESLAEKVAGGNYRAPTLLIIGDVVGLQSELNWFKK